MKMLVEPGFEEQNYSTTLPFSQNDRYQKKNRGLQAYKLYSRRDALKNNEFSFLSAKIVTRNEPIRLSVLKLKSITSL